MLKLKRLKAAKPRTERRGRRGISLALVFLLVGASWQGIVNAPIQRTSWSLPKYVLSKIIIL